MILSREEFELVGVARATIAKITKALLSIYFICFTIVLFPDSPAPARARERDIVREMGGFGQLAKVRLHGERERRGGDKT